MTHQTGDGEAVKKWGQAPRNAADSPCFRGIRSEPVPFLHSLGVSRREVLKAGVCGGLGLTLAGCLRLADAGQVRAAAGGKSAIFISLSGGPSHLDTFDLKPDAPSEYRGAFRPIKTNVPGVEFCEHLPRLARCADKFAVVRGVSHALAAHHLGTEYVNTGTRPCPTLQFPGYGAVVAQQTEAVNPPDLPPFVAIPNSNQLPGFLGVKYAPLNTGATPRAGQPFRVCGNEFAGGASAADVERRQQLLRGLDTAACQPDADRQRLAGREHFAQQRQAVMSSTRTREAFDLGRESAGFAKPFGEQPFGVSCLLAARLVESGVRFVTLSLGGWDTHQKNFTKLKDSLLPTLDSGLAALLNGLAQKGLLESTVVFVTGEFGRTPKINNHRADAGRDHYPRCMFMLLAGGGIRGGQVVGRSDERGAQPDGDGFSPDDVAATFYHCLGIDPTREYHTSSGLPIAIVRDGRIIRKLLS
jgi:uncharacterized protein (DUF1501 family)